MRPSCDVDLLSHCFLNCDSISLCPIQNEEKMEGLLEKLQLEKARFLRELLAVSGANDRSVVEARIQMLQETFEELELAAAAAFADEDLSAIGSAGPILSPNPSVLTAEFYASYLLVLLLANNLCVHLRVYATLCRRRIWMVGFTFVCNWVLLLICRNDARFLWKRIASSVKQDSETLRNAWEIGKALWQR